MSITPQDLEQLAHLAKIQIEASQTERLTHDLSNILNLVGQLESVNTEKVTPMAHPMEGLYLVPKVIE